MSRIAALYLNFATILCAAVLYAATPVDVQKELHQRNLDVTPGSCMALARAAPPPPEYLDLFKRQSRALPDIATSDLGTTDWPNKPWLARRPRPTQVRAPSLDKCSNNTGVLRYKIYNGMLYAYGDSHTREWHWSRLLYRTYFEEQLLAVMWLYRGFPRNMDIFYCWWDTPCECDLDVPFLQYTVFGNLNLGSPTTTTRNPVSSLGPRTQDSSSLRQLSTHASRGQLLRAWAAAEAATNAVRNEVAAASSQLSTSGSGQEEQAGGAASRGLAGMFDVQVQPAAFFQFEDKGRRPASGQYSRGWVLPYPDTWRELSLSPQQLRMYSNCLAARAREASSRASSRASSSSSSGSPSLSSSAPGSSAEESGLQPWPRIPQLIWRGRATGNLRGWSRHATHMPHAHANTLSTMLLNKRTHLALMSRPYPWMNVSITGLVASDLWPDFALNASGHANLLKLDELLLGVAGAPNITMESWTSFDLVLSIDGFGPPWRLPKQMLGMTPIVKVESPLKEFFAGRIQPGIHYEPVSYDLADLPARSRHLIEEAHSGSTRLHQMARAARDVAIDSFHALAQDSHSRDYIGNSYIGNSYIGRPSSSQLQHLDPAAAMGWQSNTSHPPPTHTLPSPAWLCAQCAAASDARPACMANTPATRCPAMAKGQTVALQARQQWHTL